MSISRRVMWNAANSILNIMASNYRNEFDFCLRDRSEDPPPIIPTPLLLISGKVSNPTPPLPLPHLIIPKPPQWFRASVRCFN